VSADGTLTPRELEQVAPTPQGRRFRDVNVLPEGALVDIGDQVRVVAYAEPSWWDRLNETATDNAEEHLSEIVGLFTEQGITVIVQQVVGVTVAAENADQRECYVYDLEVVGFTAPPEHVMEAAIPWLAMAAFFTAAALLTATLLVAKVEITGPGKGAKMVSNGVFWISLAVVAASVAVIVKSARTATP